MRGLDHRAEIDDRIRALRNAPENNYDAAREFYLKRRQAEIDALRAKRPPVVTNPAATSATVVPPPEEGLYMARPSGFSSSTVDELRAPPTFDTGISAVQPLNGRHRLRIN